MKTTERVSPDGVESLTRRESAILSLMAENKTNREIADQETLTPGSVKWYVNQILGKLGATDRKEAVERARELGLLTPLASPSAVPKNNLPAQLTSFIGRQKEIAELRQLLKKKTTRLLTLTGAGGTGKTRLALRVGEQVLENYADGVWLVEFASLADPLMVPKTVILALGLIEQPGKTPVAYLEDYLREKQLLLIVDNCEHLVEACAELAVGLLQAAPCLTILATSREILGVEGEIPYRLPPLMTPDSKNPPGLEEIAQFEAVRLFLERAQVVSPGLELTEGNSSEMVQICHRLDGIPLALELAAARLRILSVDQIAQRLDDAFRLLTGGSRTALPRHQTLTALIDWSNNLLTEAERSLLYRLSAFAGGWTLEAAEQVCAAGNLEQPDILDLLTQLADKSLVLTIPAEGGEMRYRMLETVRQYALARLVETGEAEAVRGRHLDYYLHLAERLEPKLRGREQIQTLDCLESELDNLRLALQWALQADIEAELRLASALMWLWHIRYHWAEGITWLEQGLEAEKLKRGNLALNSERAMIRAKALTVYGWGILHLVETPKAVESLEEALALYRANGMEHRRGLAWALTWLGECKFDEADPLRAVDLSHEALILFQEIGDSHGIAEALRILGRCETDPVRQKQFYREMLAIDEANGDTDGIATGYIHIGLAAFLEGDYESAAASFEASGDYLKRVGNSNTLAVRSYYLGVITYFNGNLERAEKYFESALIALRELANDFWVVILIYQCRLNLTQGRYDRAAELNEQVSRIAHKMGDPDVPGIVLIYRARLARLEGDAATALRCAQDGLAAVADSVSFKMLALQELGYLALQEGDLARARIHLIDSLQLFIRWRDTAWFGNPLDGLALLALREGSLEHAARLFGTRLWRGFYHTLSPVEKVERQAAFAEIRGRLRDERFEQLREEGRTLSFIQVLALAQEEG